MVELPAFLPTAAACQDLGQLQLAGSCSWPWRLRRQFTLQRRDRGRDLAGAQVSIETYRRNLQRAYVELLIGKLPAAAAPTAASAGALIDDSRAVVRAELERRLAAYPTVTLQDQVELKNAVSDQVNSLLGFLFALLALAVVIAILGIINTLLLSVVERTREIGLIRAVGATRAQVRRMIVLESLLIAVFGAVVGVVVGVV